MKIKIKLPLPILFISLFLMNTLFSHDIHGLSSIPINWKLKNGETITGHFLLLKNDTLYIECENGTVKRTAANKIQSDQKPYVLQRQRSIDSLNLIFTQKLGREKEGEHTVFKFYSDPLIDVKLILFFTILIFLFFYFNPRMIKNLNTLLLLVSILLLFSFNFATNRKMSTSTRIGFMDSAFMYYKPDISTFYDANYYYVQSNGLPDHETMLGITSWQQQVPIPQCYIGKNAWSIPLNPNIAAQPIPVNNKHFLRGAIAIAVNGIPIFNPYTNTGVDAFLDGQLDIYGGHSGRADDYHYHIAPTVLYNKIPATSPLAFALDGFAIFGNKEPDGSNQTSLDTNHGHFGKDGIYHYHIASSAPYMIKNMVGKVVEDTTLQIIPQATAKGVRPALTPLKGATIVHNILNSTKNGFTLSYTLNGNYDTVRYSWTPQGYYSYEFINSSGYSKNNYNGQPICNVPLSHNSPMLESTISAFAQDQMMHVFYPIEIEKEVFLTRIIDASGKCIYSSNSLNSIFSVSNLGTGIYYLQLKSKNKSHTTKFISY